MKFPFFYQSHHLTIAFIVIFIGTFIRIDAQTQSFPRYYAVYLNDKNGSTFSLSSPDDFLSAKALSRRVKNEIAVDSFDLPVSKAYINQVNAISFVKYCSKWQNSVLVVTNDSTEINSLTSLPFVKRLQYLGPVSNKKIKSTKNHVLPKGYEAGLDSFPDYGKSKNQLDLIGLTPMHHNLFLGKDVLIAILDAGFKSTNSMNAFATIFQQKRVLIQKDLVLPNNDIYSENKHGTNVLSTIAAILPGEYFGSAPMADFIFLRTEDVNSEYPVEEYNWLVGAEIADSAGADIITSSLSYTQFDDSTLDYNYSMLDGKSTIISKAASKAYQKGIIVLTSAGNDGNNPWRKIGFPADGIGVITVGATDTFGMYALLSSHGYSSDGRVKPDVVAVGRATALVATNDKVFYGNGTSFSTPTVAGAIATLIQAHPDKKASEIRDAVLLSTRQFNNPDTLMGYGLPDFFVADLILRGLPKKELSEFPFQILPNPFRYGFYLVTNPSDTQDIKITVYDLSGKMVYSKTDIFSPGTQAFFIGQISELANGIYVIRIETQGKAYTRKIIKQQ